MNKIETTLIENIIEAVKQAYDVTLESSNIVIEIPKDNANGDYSTNVAMRLTKQLHANPRMIAAAIVEKLNSICQLTSKIDIAGPGFINFYVKKGEIGNIVKTILAEKENYGKSDSGNGLKVIVEYVSANPTGTLHCGHARGAAWGDGLTRIMKAAGYDVLREYYINDAGNQMNNLSLSLYARYKQAFGLEASLPEDGYYGQDVIDIAKIMKEEEGDKWLNDADGWFEYFKQRGKQLELAKIERDLEYFRVGFDSWISEQSLYDSGKVVKCIEKIKSLGLTYEADGALWFRTTDYGDDKDRVLIKSDGSYTYLTPDIANHINKFDRGYSKLVNLWGADHHGYIPRMKAAINAIGYDDDALEVDIIQMVRLVENGEEVKMSKRTGNAITIRELCDDIGVDAARYFFVSKALDTHMDLDLGLAKKQSSDNPVYYAQYAHARMSSILRNAPEYKPVDEFDLLTTEKEIDLLKHLNEFPNVVADAATNRAVNKICIYIQKLAAYFHSFYTTCKVNDEANPALTNQRIGLVMAAKITLANALDLIGITAPEKM